jgi:hypothetical protein
MPYCPVCRYQYETGILICPDCQEALIDQPAAALGAAVRPDDSWVVIGSAFSLLNAEIVRGSLDSNNIPSVVLSSSFAAPGKNVDARRGVARSERDGSFVMVPREFRNEAETILQAVLGEDPSRPQAR